MEDLEKRAVVKYFNLKGLTPRGIKEEMDSTLKDFAPSYSIIKKWIEEFKTGCMSTSDEPRSGRPMQVTTSEIIEKMHCLELEHDKLNSFEVEEAVNISNERAGTSNTAMTANSQQTQQHQINQQQYLRVNMQMQNQSSLEQQQNAQQGTMGMQVQTVQVPQTLTASQASSIQAATVSAQVTHAQQVNTGGSPVSRPMMTSGRTVIWKGVLEWIEKNTNYTQKHTLQIQVSSTAKDGVPEVKAESWPQKLDMQLMPKSFIANTGQVYFTNSKSVVFHPSACEALECLIKSMSNGLGGCILFKSTSTCNIKILVLFYAVGKRTFIGFIPNDQQTFVDRLREVIEQQKSLQSPMLTQGPATLQLAEQSTGPGGNTTNVMSRGVPNIAVDLSSVGGGLQGQINNASNGMINQLQQMDIARLQNLLKIQQLLQTLAAANHQKALNEPQINELVQQYLATTTVPQNQLNTDAVRLSSVIGGPRGQINTADGRKIKKRRKKIKARQRNLLKIRQLEQKLEAAQREAKYKSQTE